MQGMMYQDNDAAFDSIARLEAATFLDKTGYLAPPRTVNSDDTADFADQSLAEFTGRRGVPVFA